MTYKYSLIMIGHLTDNVLSIIADVLRTVINYSSITTVPPSTLSYFNREEFVILRKTTFLYLNDIVFFNVASLTKNLYTCYYFKVYF